MSAALWFLTGLTLGLSVIGIPVLIWLNRFLRDWGRSW